MTVYRLFWSEAGGAADVGKQQVPDFCSGCHRRRGEVRDTRGFIYLKLGDPALALNEYNAALTIDPNRALSLYGRGLARIRMSDGAGKGDQEAALTINPEVANDFAIHGLK